MTGRKLGKRLVAPIAVPCHCKKRREVAEAVFNLEKKYLRFLGWVFSMLRV
jgi:hypothetical protein